MKKLGLFFYQYVSNSLKETTRYKRTVKQHRSTTMYMVVLKLGMSSLFFPTSKQEQSLKNLTKKLIQYCHYQGKPQEV